MFFDFFQQSHRIRIPECPVQSCYGTWKSDLRLLGGYNQINPDSVGVHCPRLRWLGGTPTSWHKEPGAHVIRNSRPLDFLVPNGSGQVKCLNNKIRCVDKQLIVTHKYFLFAFPLGSVRFTFSFLDCTHSHLIQSHVFNKASAHDCPYYW